MPKRIHFRLLGSLNYAYMISFLFFAKAKRRIFSLVTMPLITLCKNSNVEIYNLLFLT
jgi:hypothetical protein